MKGKIDQKRVTREGGVESRLQEGQQDATSQSKRKCSEGDLEIW